MTYSVQNQRSFFFSSNYMMHAFGTESQITKKTLTLVATLGGTYFSFQYLPPGVDMWVGGLVLVTGTALLIFGSVSKILEFLGDFFSHVPAPTGPYSYPPPDWTEHKASPYHIPSPHLPPQYPAPPLKRHYDSPYKPPASTHPTSRPVVIGPDGRPATLSPTFGTSGTRPHKKDPEYKRTWPSPPSYSSSPSHWHFEGNTGGLPKPVVIGSENRSATLSPTFEISGTRPQRKDSGHKTPSLSSSTSSGFGGSTGGYAPSYGTTVQTSSGTAQVHQGSHTSGTRPQRK